MAAFNFNPFMQYTKNDGSICNGGQLVFTDPQTDLAKDVYSDSGLSVSLGNTVELNSAGRPTTDIFLDGDYNVELLDAPAPDGVQIALRENVNVQGSASASLPLPSDGEEDQVLSTDGVDWVWRDVREVPDPSGASGKYLGTDGELLNWTAFAAAAEIPEVTDTPGKVIWGDTMLLYGSDTAPSAAAIFSTKTITFATAFSGTPKCYVCPTSAGVTSDTPAARCSGQALSASTTGFTASVFAGAEDEGNGSTNLTSSVAFDWFAIGPA